MGGFLPGSRAGVCRAGAGLKASWWAALANGLGRKKPGADISLSSTGSPVLKSGKEGRRLSFSFFLPSPSLPTQFENPNPVWKASGPGPPRVGSTCTIRAPSCTLPVPGSWCQSPARTRISDLVPSGREALLTWAFMLPPTVFMSRLAPSRNTHDLAVLHRSLSSALKLNIEPYIRLRLEGVATVYLR